MDKQKVKVYTLSMEAVPLSVRGRKTPMLPLFCAAGALLNPFGAHFLRDVAGIPLFMDTIFTVALTFYGGLFWGALTGALSNLILHSVYFFGWGDYLFTLCNIAVALITAFFIRLFPGELHFPPAPRKTKSETFTGAIDTVIVLLILSFTMCVAISLLGGLISAVIKTFFPSRGGDGPEIFFKLILFRKNLPLAAAEILSRIPVNIIDRLVAVFGGYGIALLLSRKKRPGSARLPRGKL
jgi:hypothetical protein